MEEQKKRTAREIIENYDGPAVRIMEVCGTHTHEIFRLGIRKLLPKQVELISGPGCPVCVTPVSFIDEAIYLALEKQVTICTFGDLVRVPGSQMSLAGAREKGAKIHIVYSPADAEKYAKDHPEEQVTFLSVGFETTTPAGCLSVKQAKEDGISNYSLLVANKTMPGAYEALKGSADVFLYPGHVNAITGTELCEELVKEGVSGVVAGFTAKELLTALAVALVRFQEGKPFFVNCYPRVVTREGSREATDGRMRQRVERSWNHSGIRYAAERRMGSIRCQKEIQYAKDRRKSKSGMPLRRCTAGKMQTVRLQGVWQGMYTAAPGRSLHGIRRGRMLGLLYV